MRMIRVPIAAVLRWSALAGRGNPKRLHVAPPGHKAVAAILASGILAALGSLWAQPATAVQPSPEDQLERRVQDLERELASVKAELAQMKAERERAAAAPAAPPSPVAAAATPAPSPLSSLSVWGYGEVYFTQPVHNQSAAQADLARAVIGIGYQFDERTSFNSEFEVEHAVASASDVGEFEVEQFYVDHQITPWATIRGGLFLMPFGLLNEHHEPTNFYGMQRNFVETLIIPSTWREGGLQFNAHTDSGLAFAVGATTGFDLSKWNYTPTQPLYNNALELENSGVAPLQASHQELALANAQHAAGHLAVNYSGVPGLLVGAAAFVGDAVQPPAPVALSGNQRVSLWDAHVRWLPRGFDLSAVYARGAISNLATANAAHPGASNPIPSAFYGYFLQAAYPELWSWDSYRLAPFVRYEYYNMGSAYEGVPGPVVPPPFAANGGWPQNYDRVWTVGTNFYVTPHVVLKLDYQSFDVNHDFTRLDLGLGLNF
jgi:hypothetical protein